MALPVRNWWHPPSAVNWWEGFLRNGEKLTFKFRKWIKFQKFAKFSKFLKKRTHNLSIFSDFITLEGGYNFFCFIRLNFSIDMSKIPNFSRLRCRQAPQANIFIKIFVRFSKKSTKMLIFFIKDTKFFTCTFGTWQHVSKNQLKGKIFRAQKLESKNS